MLAKKWAVIDMDTYLQQHGFHYLQGRHDNIRHGSIRSWAFGRKGREAFSGLLERGEAVSIDKNVWESRHGCCALASIIQICPFLSRGCSPFRLLLLGLVDMFKAAIRAKMESGSKKMIEVVKE